MSGPQYHLQVRFSRLKHHVQLTDSDPTGEQLAAAISSVTTADPETIKLLQPGKSGKAIRLREHGAERASQIGLVSGAVVTMYASTAAEVQRVRTSKDLPGLADFQQELKQHMRRQRGSRAATLTLPSGPYTFQGYKAWQHDKLSPEPSEALKLLHRLAADPGIVGIMTKHRWSVGLLSEMAPEGKVGISPMCILGVNINRGQEISLRLRTDDLKGFRRYDRIRETLCHELAHMVWGEHDDRFKQLNSQLLKECGQLDWTSHAGHSVQAFEDPIAATWVDEDNVMAVTAQTSGQTLRQLTGGQQSASVIAAAASPGRAAAMAASARLTASVSPDKQAQPQSPLPVPASGASSPQHNAAQADAGVTGGQPAAELPVDPSAGIASLGHRDATTEEAEEAMRQLGSTDFTSEAQQIHNDSDAPVQQHASGLPAETPVQYPLLDPAVTQNLHHSVLHSNAVQHTAPEQEQHASSGAVGHTPAPATATHNPTSQAPQLPLDQSARLPTDIDSMPTSHTVPGQDEQSHLSAAAMDMDVEDPALQRYRKAEAAVAHLRSEAGAAKQQAALQTLLKILRNIVSHPGESKYSQIRLGNPAFYARAGQFAAARELLAVAGFAEEVVGAVDKVLVWKRHDQGLLWLTLSAVENAIQ